MSFQDKYLGFITLNRFIWTDLVPHNNSKIIY